MNRANRAPPGGPVEPVLWEDGPLNQGPEEVPGELFAGFLCPPAIGPDGKLRFAVSVLPEAADPGSARMALLRLEEDWSLTPLLGVRSPEPGPAAWWLEGAVPPTGGAFGTPLLPATTRGGRFTFAAAAGVDGEPARFGIYAVGPDAAATELVNLRSLSIAGGGEFIGSPVFSANDAGAVALRGEVRRPAADGPVEVLWWKPPAGPAEAVLVAGDAFAGGVVEGFAAREQDHPVPVPPALDDAGVLSALVTLQGGGSALLRRTPGRPLEVLARTGDAYERLSPPAAGGEGRVAFLAVATLPELPAGREQDRSEPPDTAVLVADPGTPVREVARAGDPAPAPGVAGGVEGTMDGVFASFREARVGPGGRVLLHATLADGREGLFVVVPEGGGDRMLAIARSGDTLAGETLVTLGTEPFDRFAGMFVGAPQDRPMNAAGEVAFRYDVEGGETGLAVWSPDADAAADADGSGFDEALGLGSPPAAVGVLPSGVQWILTEGDPLPGAGGRLEKVLEAHLGPDGEVLFSAAIAGDPANDTSVYKTPAVYASGAFLVRAGSPRPEPQTLVRVGDPVPGTLEPVDQIHAVGLLRNGGVWLSMNAARPGLADPTHQDLPVLLHGEGDPIRLRAELVGGGPPEGNGRFGLVAVLGASEAGGLGLLAALTDTDAAQPDFLGFYFLNPGEPLTTVARQGGPASGVDGSIFAWIGDWQMNAGGRIAFATRLRDADEATRSALFASDGGAAAGPLVVEGEELPGGGTLGPIEDFVLLPDGAAVFTNPDPQGPSGGGPPSLFRVEPGGGVTVLARHGDALPGGAGTWLNLRWPKVNRRGDVLVVASTAAPGVAPGEGGTSGLWVFPAGGGPAVCVVQEGDALPGRESFFGLIGNATIDDLGRVGFSAVTEGVEFRPGRALFLASPGEPPGVVAFPGDAFLGSELMNVKPVPGVGPQGGGLVAFSWTLQDRRAGLALWAPPGAAAPE